MTIGLLFGTFDPVHEGHIEIANNRILTEMVDQVWFVITPESPFKKGKIITSQEHRLAMVNLAIEDYINFEASDIEFQLSHPQYTANTLRYLKNKHSEYNFLIIMGSDNYGSLLADEWKDSEYILKNFKICVYQRTDETPVIGEEMGSFLEVGPLFLLPNHIQLPGNIMQWSSSWIRSTIRHYSNRNREMYRDLERTSIDDLTPSIARPFFNQKVLEYIQNHKLYIE